MQKVIKLLDEKRGIVQCTVADERWYFKASKDQQTGNPVMKAVPSVTWIAGHWPKGIHFYKWLAEQGWDESQAIKQAAGDKGSKVHEALSAIIRGEEVRIDSKFVNRSKSTEEVPYLEELTFDEVECIISFLDWRKTLTSFEPVAWDITVFSEQFGYAGSVDLIARVDGELYIIDFKTSQYIWDEYELQVSAYRRAVENGENPIYMTNPNGTENTMVDVSSIKTAILQVGYKKNKARFKFTETPDRFDDFIGVAKKIWERTSATQEPRRVDIPVVLSPAITLDEAMGTDPKGEAPLKKNQESSMKTSREIVLKAGLLPRLQLGIKTPKGV